MSETEPIGYGRPPHATRFRSGQSGNPRGRPRNRHRQIPHDVLLGQMVTIREAGRERRVTAAEAFVLQLTQKGLAGDSAAARASLEAIEVARGKRIDGQEHLKVIISLVAMGIETILQPLGIAVKKFPTDKDRARWELEPWVVEAALARLGEQRLTKEEQREVWSNTRTPNKVKWPAWWTVKNVR